MNIYIKVFYISILFICPSVIFGQGFISNPSLEDKPADATMPTGWFSMEKGTTPDIMPGYWGVYLEAEDGETYVGLITRSDGSFESIGQRMEKPLEKASCYEMSMDLAYSENYSGYNEPLKIRIYLSTKKGKRQQLVYESPIIDSEEWEHYKFDFYPEKNMKFFIMEAFNPYSASKEGNILIDNIQGPRICNKA